MNSRELVEMAYSGQEPQRVPVHFETVEKHQEVTLGDVLLGHAWVPMWGLFFDEGGPFKRDRKDLARWAVELDIEEGYDWPSLDEVVQETLQEFRESIKNFIDLNKFIVFEVIGPTEQSEYFLCPPKPPSGFDLELAYHTFDFGVLTVIDKEKAKQLYDRIANYVLELIKAGTEIEWVDAVRVADDAFTYSGPIYPDWFMDKLYMPWHKKFTGHIHKKGKYAILHTDGNVSAHDHIKTLSEIYDGLHPLDLAKKGTVLDAMHWINDVVKARTSLERNMVFHTGIPIDLMMLDEVSALDVLRVVSTFLNKHGRKNLVLSVTHRPYPKRNFLEDLVFEKVRAIRRLVGLPDIDAKELTLSEE